MNPQVDFFFAKAKTWQPEMEKLRKVALSCGLTEELKWGQPCYTLQGSNIVLIHGFKAYCALLFFKGALLKDAGGLLIQQTANVQAARQLRFTGLQQIDAQETLIKTYIQEAIDIEKAGLKVALKDHSQLVPTDELQRKFAEHPALQAAFAALTPGRQRAYHLYFSQPKQAKTREARIEKCMPRILSGKGLND
ncbi:YdeI/OmpD-associated family protein [Mucilaginibacter sp.]